MKTKEEEKRITEKFRVAVNELRDSHDALSSFLKCTEDYMRSIKATSQNGMLLADQFMKLAASQSSQDITDLYTSFGSSLKKLETTRDQAFFNDIFVPLRRHLENDRKQLDDFLRLYTEKQKSVQASIKKAEDKSKRCKSKNPTELQDAIRNLNEAIKGAQQLNVNALRNALFMQRGKYCSIAGHMGNVVGWYQELSSIGVEVSEFKDKFVELGKKTKTLPTDFTTLVETKTRTFIDISTVSSDWKKIFQAAGVKKSDLKNPETAKIILDTIEKATGKKIAMPPMDALDEYEDPDNSSSPLEFNAPQSASSFSSTSELSAKGSFRQNDFTPASPRITSRRATMAFGRERLNTSSNSSFGSRTLHRESNAAPPLPQRGYGNAFSLSETENLPPPLPERSFDGTAAPPLPQRSGGERRAPAVPQRHDTLSSFSQQPAIPSTSCVAASASSTSPSRPPAALPVLDEGTDSTDLEGMLRTALATRRTAVVDDAVDDDDDDDVWSD